MEAGESGEDQRRRGGRLAVGLLAAFAVAAIVGWSIARTHGIDTDLSALTHYDPPISTRVVDRNGALIAEFYEERRQLVSLDAIPEHVIAAFLAAEDDRFFQHAGFEPRAILRAAWANLRSRRIEQGASTITQQLVRNLWLSSDRNYGRKLQELVLARVVERRLSKETILHAYLNEIYFGSGAYGVAEAARTYFAKTVGDLSVSEAALLAGLPQRPSEYSPHRRPEAAEARRRSVLARMHDEGALDELGYQAALATPPKIAAMPHPLVEPAAAFFVEEVRRVLTESIGGERLRRGGLRIETTLDLDVQRAAVAALRKGLERVHRRNGGAPDTAPSVEGAVVSLDVRSGDVLALVGGYDFARSEFDRAVQARRQAGSAFKPFVYAAALERGYTGASVIEDEPFVFVDRAGREWAPRNYDGEFRGPVTMREALTRSLNNATVQLLDQVGLRRTIDVARRLGIHSPIPPELGVALGSNSVSVLELTSAYGTLANFGRRQPHRIVTRVTDAHGEVVHGPAILGVDPSVPEYEAPASGVQVMKSQVAWIMTDMLQATIREHGGTGSAALGLGVPIAGKTGTTNDNIDAWFIGYSPKVVTGVWVGHDSLRPLGRRESGARTALPIWKDTMRVAVDRGSRFRAPRGIVVREIDADTGFLADDFSERVFFQAFVAGSQPVQAAQREVERPEERLRHILLRALSF